MFVLSVKDKNANSFNPLFLAGSFCPLEPGLGGGDASKPLLYNFNPPLSPQEGHQNYTE